MAGLALGVEMPGQGDQQVNHLLVRWVAAARLLQDAHRLSGGEQAQEFPDEGVILAALGHGRPAVLPVHVSLDLGLGQCADRLAQAAQPAQLVLGVGELSLVLVARAVQRRDELRQDVVDGALGQGQGERGAVQGPRQLREEGHLGRVQLPSPAQCLGLGDDAILGQQRGHQGELLFLETASASWASWSLDGVAGSAIVVAVVVDVNDPALKSEACP